MKSATARSVRNWTVMHPDMAVCASESSCHFHWGVKRAKRDERKGESVRVGKILAIHMLCGAWFFGSLLHVNVFSILRFLRNEWNDMRQKLCWAFALIFFLARALRSLSRARSLSLSILVGGITVSSFQVIHFKPMCIQSVQQGGERAHTTRIRMALHILVLFSFFISQFSFFFLLSKRKRSKRR